MATIEVSTWAELVSAIGSSAANDTIKLIDDVDCNDEMPEGVTTRISISKTITIDGSYTEDNVVKNHIIRNLRTHVSSPVEIFYINSKPSVGGITPIFKNIDFLNLILGKPLFLQGNPKNLTIRDCRFTGKRTHNLMQNTSSNYGGKIYIYSSYFNVPYYGTDSGEKVSLASNFDTSGSYALATYANYCRFKETYTGTYTPDTTYWGNSCGVSNIWLNGCRVEGEIVSSHSWDGNQFNIAVLSSNALGAGTPTMQNVVDCDIYTYGLGETVNPVQVKTPKGVFKTPVCRWEDKMYSFTLATPLSDTIPASSSEIEDTDYLIENGFDVVPSNI